jgi:hypothetical protein
MNIETLRKRIEMQGFTGLSDTEIRQINYPLRLAPAICLSWTALGVVLGSPLILAALVPFALAGALFEGHPFDAIYNYGLRHFDRRPELPAYGPPRRSACLMATAMILMTAAAFYCGLAVAGYILGTVMMTMASINVITGFCVPSFFYRVLFGRMQAVNDHGDKIMS